MSQVLLRCYDFPPRISGHLFASLPGSTRSSSLRVSQLALPVGGGDFRARAIVQPATRSAGALARGRERDLPGSQTIHPVPLPRSTTPAEPTIPRLLDGLVDAAPTLPTVRASALNEFRGSITRLWHLLPTLQDWCCHHPCKARFRLAGSPLPGGSRTLRIATKGFRSQSHPPFLDLSWRKGSFILNPPSLAVLFDHLVGVGGVTYCGDSVDLDKLLVDVDGQLLLSGACLGPCRLSEVSPVHESYSRQNNQQHPFHRFFLSIFELLAAAKWTLKTHPRARSRLRVYHIHRAPVLVDHIGCAPGRQNRALLPRADPAQMFTGEVEGAVRRIEERVFALLAMTESRGEAEAVRHLAPRNCHWLLELPAPAGMQTLDCRARHVELFVQRSACYFVRLSADRIGAEQNPLRRKEAVAGIPDQCGRSCRP